MGLSIEIDRQAFESALAAAQNVAQRRTPAQVLTNVHLETSGQGVRLFATDYDVSLTREVPAEIRTPGTAALPARVLYDIVRKAGGDRIQLEVDAQHQGVVRTGARSRYKLMGLDPEDFPNPAQVPAEPAMELDRDLFKHWIRKTIFAASTDEARAALAGVFLEVDAENDLLRFVATDTHRLSLMKVPGLGAAGVLPEEGVILPRKALQELIKILDGEGTVQLSVEMPYVRLAWDDTVLVFRTVEGRFPAYRSVIPERYAKKAVLDRADFQAAIDRVSLVVTDRFKSVLLRFETGTLTLIARNPDMGEGEEQIDCRYEGDPLEVGFNAQYVQDALNELTHDQVELRLSDDVSPTVLCGEGDEEYLSVVMPMRI